MRRLDEERSRTRVASERRLAELRRAIDRMIDAVAAGDLTSAAIGRRIAEAEAAKLEDTLANTAPPDVIALHPKAIEHYLAAISTLAETLAARNDQEAMKPIRELIHSIIVYPRQPRDPVRFDIRGRLAALLNNDVGLKWCQGRHHIELLSLWYAL